MLLLSASCGRDEERVQAPLADGPVILISIDTLRADRLAPWGGAVRTPALDSLARDGVVFTNAWSQVPLTLPSHSTIFTGLLPGEHGVRDNLGYRLGEGIPTTAEVLRTNGWRTGGAVSSWVLRDATGVARGFEWWDDELDAGESRGVGDLQREGSVTARKAVEWLTSGEVDRSFLFVHLFEPHTPYEPADPFRTQYSNPYDGEVAEADAIVGQILDELKARDIYEKSTVIVLSDHGEGLGDHGEAEHGIFLYREAIQVPLYVKLPASAHAGEIVTSAAGLHDVHPTILRLAGVPGESPETTLLDLMRAGAPARQIFSESMYPRIHLGWSELLSLTDGETHVIQAPRPELYRLTEDPGERNNVIDDHRRLYAAFRQEIASRATTYAPPSAVDAEEAAKLSALGYLGAGAGTTSGPLPDAKDRIGDLAMMTKASTAAARGDHETAIALYRTVLESNPSLADGWIQLGAALEAAGMDAEAIAAYRQAIELAPSLAPGIALSLSRIYLRQGDLDQAGKHAALAVPHNPNPAKIVIGRVAWARGDHLRAESIARESMADPTTRSDAVVLIAQARIAQKDPAGALQLLEQERDRLAAEGLPVPSLFHFAEGDALARLGRMEQAIEAFRMEIGRFPTNPDPYANLTAILLLQGNEREAIGVMEELVRNRPGADSRRVARETFMRLGRPELAKRWAEET